MQPRIQIIGPVEHIRIRLQTQQTRLYAGPLDCVAQIVRQSGVPGLFRGMLPTMLREAQGMGVYFLAYESLVQRYLIKSSKHRADLPATMAMLFGASAGVAVRRTALKDLIYARLFAMLIGQKFTHSSGYRHIHSSASPVCSYPVAGLQPAYSPKPHVFFFISALQRYQISDADRFYIHFKETIQRIDRLCSAHLQDRRAQRLLQGTRPHARKSESSSVLNLQGFSVCAKAERFFLMTEKAPFANAATFVVYEWASRRMEPFVK